MNDLRTLSLTCVMLLLGCDSINEPDQVELFVPVDVLEWRTEGGGNLYFDVRRNTQGDFTIDVIQQGFRPVGVTVTLTREASLPVYDLVEQVFQGKINIAGLESQEYLPTGTWTHVYLVDRANQRHKVTSSHLRGELRALRYWVEDQISASSSTNFSNAPEPTN